MLQNSKNTQTSSIKWYEEVKLVLTKIHFSTSSGTSYMEVVNSIKGPTVLKIILKLALGGPVR